MKVKVGYLLHTLVPGGASISFTFLYNSIKKYSIEKNLFAPADAPISLQLCKMRGIEADTIKKLPFRPLYNDQINSTSLVRFLQIYRKNRKESVQLIKDSGCDVLHINSSVFPHLLPVLHTETDIKVVVHVRELVCKHGMGIVQRYFISMISRYADAIIAISDNEAAYFRGAKNLFVIPNPFDFDIIKNVEPFYFRTHYGFSESTVVISMFGYFARAKGHLEALKAFECLKSLLPDADYKFVIVGSQKPEIITPGKLKRRVKKLLNILRIKRYVEFDFFNYIKKKQLDKDLLIIDYCSDVYKLIQDSDIIIRPALSADPWGRDIIEAMAFRKPVVATGISEFYIENNKTGFLVPPRNPQMMAEKLAYLINHPCLIKEMGNAGYDKVFSMCNSHQYGEKIVSVYKELLSNKSIN